MRTTPKNGTRECEIHLHRLHTLQQFIKDALFKRKVVRAGRRGGKTVLASDIAIDSFLRGQRPLYASPTADQLNAFWYEVCQALHEPIKRGVLQKNEVEHTIEVPGTRNRLRAKTAWNADTLRGDYTDMLILDEFQLMNEDTWEVVGVPMLLDNNGDAIFFYTPPSLHSRSVTKARDPRHASKLYQRAVASTDGRWGAFHFTSADNPFISQQALAEITKDMTQLAYRQEILAEEFEEVAGALWSRAMLTSARVVGFPQLVRVVVGVDPPGGRTECGIVVAGLGSDGQAYVIDDKSLAASPNTWAQVAITAYNRNSADRIVGETNYGGDMVENTIVQAAKALGQTVAYKSVHASRGKALRAEPIAAGYEQLRIHHVGEFSYLEDEMCTFVPGVTRESPNRLDAAVWALTELLVETPQPQHDFMIGAAV